MLDEELNVPPTIYNDDTLLARLRTIHLTERAESVRAKLEEIDDVGERLHRWAEMLQIDFRAILKLLRSAIREMELLHAANWVETSVAHLAHQYAYDFDELRSALQRAASVDGAAPELLFDRIVHDARDADASLLNFLARRLAA